MPSFERIILFSLLSFTAFSCRQTGIEATNCRSGKCTYTFSDGKEIRIEGDTLSQFVQIGAGSFRVFDYQYVKNDKENIADDEYTENIYFQVDPSLESFSYSGAELDSIRLTMQPVCFCPARIATVVSGTVTGTRISDSRWQIDIDATFDWAGSTEETVISAEFEEVK